MTKLLVCCACGCKELQFTADAFWDIEKQKFGFVIDEEYVFCPQCEDQTCVEEVELIAEDVINE